MIAFYEELLKVPDAVKDAVLKWFIKESSLFHSMMFQTYRVVFYDPTTFKTSLDKLDKYLTKKIK